MYVQPQGAAETGKICLQSITGVSDYGEWITLPEYECTTDGKNYAYIITKDAIYKRSLNYWFGSPYGWRKVECTATCKESSVN